MIKDTMKAKDLMELIAKLHIKDEDGEILRVKQIIIKHFKNPNRAKHYLRKLIKDYSEIQRAIAELEEEGILWRFAVDSYYGNEYLKLYIIKLIDDEIKVVKGKTNLTITNT